MNSSLSWLPPCHNNINYKLLGRQHTTSNTARQSAFCLVLFCWMRTKHSTTRQNTTASDHPSYVDKEMSRDLQRLRRAIYRIFFDSVCCKTRLLLNVVCAVQFKTHTNDAVTNAFSQNVLSCRVTFYDFQARCCMSQVH